MSPASTLDRLGWSHYRDHVALSLDASPDDPEDARPARVIDQAPSIWRVHDGRRELLARRRRRVLAESPVTGDWVMVSGADDDVLMERVLPRRTVLARAAAGRRRDRQVLAANVDLVGVCAPADDVNARRIERELTAVWESGALPLLIVTKCDLVADPAATVAASSWAAVGADVVAVSAVTGAGLDDLAGRIHGGATLALIGPSGVGKSSLVNRLLGTDLLATSEVRRDGKGRHTTTSRHLVTLPQGGVLLDTPGMREFAPWADTDVLDETFADLDARAAGCRFSDCRHEVEPDCAVLEAAAADDDVAARLASWRALQRELAWLARRNDARAMAEERRRWAVLQRSARSRIRR